MDKLKMHTPDLTQDHISRLRELFPNCVTETKDAQDKIKLAVDFDLLRQELSGQIVEGPQERYHLNWPGKREALLTANAPIAKTLRPARDESVDFDTTKNLFIEGDNLDALKLLQEAYLGKVKMIYIDPPYNTGNDFIYNDDFSEDVETFKIRSNQKDEAGNRLVTNTSSNGRFHSDWLSMMYSRIKLARNMLKDDGCIALSIDENELPNLWHICDEIFGEENFVECMVYDKKAAPKGVPPVNMIVGVHEYILVFQKTDMFSFLGVPRSKDGFSNPDNDPRGMWRNTNCKSTVKDKGSAYEVVDPKTGISYRDAWAFTKSEMDKMATTGQLIFPKSRDGQVRMKEYYSEFKNQNIPIKSSLGLYDAQANTEMLTSIMGGKFFQNPKHIDLMQDLISYICQGNDIVLDFFAGSATTAHAIIKLNAEKNRTLKFILVQLAESISENTSAFEAGFRNISELSKERIRRAGKKIQEENPLFKGDVGFRVLKIDTSNMSDIYYVPDAIRQSDLLKSVDNIKADRTSEDLLFQVIVDWGSADLLTAPITREKLAGKYVYFVDGNALAACFDMGISEDFVKELAARKPLRAVFRDNGFASDAVKINVNQIFKQLSPSTEVKSI